jgi:hypothetical protein
MNVRVKLLNNNVRLFEIAEDAIVCDLVRHIARSFGVDPRNWGLYVKGTTQDRKWIDKKSSLCVVRHRVLYFLPRTV